MNKFIVVMKQDNKIVSFENDIEKLNSMCFESQSSNTIYSYANCAYYDIDDSIIPSSIPMIDLITKYCYDPTQGFYTDPNYVEPDPNYGVDSDIIEKIQADYREKLIKEVGENGYNA